jgi:hypothetical protein
LPIFFKLVLGYTFVMSKADFDPKEDVQLFLENAREMLSVAG